MCPTYEFLCQDCNHEWEDFRKMNDPMPPCPTCQKENTKRLISGGSGRGIVNLTGQDLVNKVKADAAAIETHAANNENYAASFLGEGLYERKQKEMDTAKREGVFRRSR